MVQKYRCKGCGYYHIGPAPERCPVCGSPKSFFLPYEGPGDLTGTRTLDNLKSAIAGESQANRRYTLFSRVAELEGAASAVAAFDHAAAEETAHALGHLAYAGMVGSTAENLKASVEGETYEFIDMYPQFAEEAEAEGFPEIAYFFRNVGGFEKKHKEQYETALKDLEG